MIIKSLLIGAMLSITPLQFAHSQNGGGSGQLCMSQSLMKEFLKETQGMVPTFEGLVDANMGGETFVGLHQIYLNFDTREYIITITRPKDKITCIMTMGKNFEVSTKQVIILKGEPV